MAILYFRYKRKHQFGILGKEERKKKKNELDRKHESHWFYQPILPFSIKKYKIYSTEWKWNGFCCSMNRLSIRSVICLSLIIFLRFCFSSSFKNVLERVVIVIAKSWQINWLCYISAFITVLIPLKTIRDIPCESCMWKQSWNYYFQLVVHW